jgi:hypothetical protein
MKTLTLKLPNDLHRKVCKLAAIAHRSPAQLAFKEIQALAVQGHDERDLDFIIPFFVYRTKETAAKVAQATNAFMGRKFDKYDVAGPDEDGNFSVLTEEESGVIANIIPFSAPVDYRLQEGSDDDQPRAS